MKDINKNTYDNNNNKKPKDNDNNKYDNGNFHSSNNHNYKACQSNNPVQIGQKYYSSFFPTSPTDASSRSPNFHLLYPLSIADEGASTEFQSFLKETLRLIITQLIFLTSSLFPSLYFISAMHLILYIQHTQEEIKHPNASIIESTPYFQISGSASNANLSFAPSAAPNYVSSAALSKIPNPFPSFFLGPIQSSSLDNAPSFAPRVEPTLPQSDKPSSDDAPSLALRVELTLPQSDKPSSGSYSQPRIHPSSTLVPIESPSLHLGPETSAMTPLPPRNMSNVASNFTFT